MTADERFEQEIDQSVGQYFKDLRIGRNISIAGLSRILWPSVTEDTARQRLSRIEDGKSPVKLVDLHRFAAALGVDSKSLVRILLPNDHSVWSTEASFRQLELEKMHVTRELDRVREQRSGSSAIDLDFLEEIVSTGRWAASVRPKYTGPTPATEVLSSTLITITPAAAGLIPSDSTARAELDAQFGDRIFDRAVYAGTGARPMPEPPVSEDELGGKHIVHMYVPGFTRDRPATDLAASLPGLRPESIAVVAISQGAWRENIAALLARSFGWGLENSVTKARFNAPVTTPDPDEHVERSNKLRNDGLRRLLRQPPNQTIVHHAGRDVMDSEGRTVEQHPVVEAASDSLIHDRLPFVIVLSESNRMIDYQERKVLKADGTPRYTQQQWRTWRDELRAAGDTLYRHGLGMVVPIDHAWDLPKNPGDKDTPPSDAHLSNQLHWKRSTILAKKIGIQLLKTGHAGTTAMPNIDPQAAKMLDLAGELF